MTSAKSLRNKAALYDFKRSVINILPVIAMIFIAGCVFFIRDINNGLTIKGEMQMLLGGAHERRSFLYNIYFGACGLVGALLSFSFLLQKKQVNVYLSMGITRKQLFINRAVAFLLPSAAAIAVFMAVSVLLNTSFFGFSPIIVQHGAVEALILYVCALTGFGIGLLAIFLAGNIFEFLIISGIFYLIPTVIFHSLSIFFASVFGVYCVGRIGLSPDFAKGTDFLTKFSFLNPLFTATKIGARTLGDDAFEGSIVSAYNNPRFEYLSFGYIAPSLIWLAIFAVMIIASYKLLEKRKAEIAGKFGMSRALGMLCAVTVSLYAAMMFIDNTFILGRWSLVLATVIFVIFSVFLMLLFTLNKKYARKNTKIIFGIGAVLCTLLFAASFDVAGYKRNIPEAQDIETAYISVMADDYLQTANHYRTGRSTGGVNYFYSSYNDIGPIKSEEDLKQLVQVANGVAGCEGEKFHTNVFVRFETKDGKTIFRNYNYVTEDALYSILSLYDGEWRDDRIEHAFTAERDKNVYEGDEFRSYKRFLNENELKLVHPFSGKSALLGSPQENRELLEALKTDLKAQTAQQLFTPSESPIALIKFESADYGYPSLEGNIYVYRYMKNTMAYFEKNGLFDALSDLDADFIKADVVSVKEYDAEQPSFSVKRDMRSPQFFSDMQYYGVVETGEFSGNMTGITDEAIITELKKNAVTTYYITGERGYYVRLWQKDGMLTYLYLSEDKLPEKLR